MGLGHQHVIIAPDFRHLGARISEGSRISVDRRRDLRGNGPRNSPRGSLTGGRRGEDPEAECHRLAFTKQIRAAFFWWPSVLGDLETLHGDIQSKMGISKGGGQDISHSTADKGRARAAKMTRHRGVGMETTKSCTQMSASSSRAGTSHGWLNALVS